MGQVKPLWPCGQISSCSIFRRKSKWCWCLWWGQQSWRMCVIVRSPSIHWQTVTSKRHGLVHHITETSVEQQRAPPKRQRSQNFFSNDMTEGLFTILRVDYMQSLTLVSLQHIAKSVLWCSHFIQIIANMTFFLWSPYVWVVKVVLCLCVHACVCLHIFKAVAGMVDCKHKHKMWSVNEKWKISKTILLVVQQTMILWRWKIDMWGNK